VTAGWELESSGEPRGTLYVVVDVACWISMPNHRQLLRVSSGVTSR
jgi:hypothetical protein